MSYGRDMVNDGVYHITHDGVVIGMALYGGEREWYAADAEGRPNRRRRHGSAREAIDAVIAMHALDTPKGGEP